MRPAVATWLAWSMWALTMVVAGLGARFIALRPLEGFDAFDLIVSILIMASFPTVGALIASRRPRNPIGWIFSAMGLLFVTALLSGSYAQYGLVEAPGSLRGAETAGWIQNWIWPVLLAPIGFVLLLFPDGRPASRRWRPVVWILAGGLAGWFVSAALGPGPLAYAGYGIPNPFGIEALGGIPGPLSALSGILLLGSVLASVVSIIMHFRRSRGDERQQLKWFAYAGALVGLTAVISLTAEGTAGTDPSPIVDLLQLSLATTLSAVPIAAGIAILRYRLYDIDLVINRTLVYGSLTVVLAAVYVAGVVLLPRLVRLGEGNDLAVAGSTLAVAGLFSPLRRQVQGFVDRQFYRSRYDAQRTVEAFSSRLREEVDLEELTSDLVALVRKTLQPAHVSVWLAGSPVARPGRGAGS
jgi:hypothetical protein